MGEQFLAGAIVGAASVVEVLVIRAILAERRRIAKRRFRRAVLRGFADVVFPPVHVRRGMK
ncbi:MAG: hypothetical protein KGM49_00510 [Sphingomonadales bacterium]|nr:hypothetical protein [Sphingomonadales bacterium]